MRLAVVVLLLASGWIAFEAARWPDVAALVDTFPRSTAFIDLWKDRQRGAGRRGDPDWRVVPYARISPHLKRAVLVGEDVNFFSHHGFEVAEMKAALKDAWDDRELPRGASTITQQLAKNLWLSPSRNPLRKVKEAILTRQLESSLSKRRILDLYLNVVEFGPGIYGAEWSTQLHRRARRPARRGRTHQRQPRPGRRLALLSDGAHPKPGTHHHFVAGLVLRIVHSPHSVGFDIAHDRSGDLFWLSRRDWSDQLQALFGSPESPVLPDPREREVWMLSRIVISASARPQLQSPGFLAVTPGDRLPADDSAQAAMLRWLVDQGRRFRRCPVLDARTDPAIGLRKKIKQ